jgi:hypothetical protein
MAFQLHDVEAPTNRVPISPTWSVRIHGVLRFLDTFFHFTSFRQYGTTAGASTPGQNIGERYVFQNRLASPSSADDDTIPIFLLKQTRVPSWVPSCTIDFPFHSYTEALYTCSGSIDFFQVQPANQALIRRITIMTPHAAQPISP